MAEDAPVAPKGIYKLITRSHDGGQLVPYAGSAKIVRGEPVISSNYVLGVALTDSVRDMHDKELCTVQVSGICTIAATFVQVTRGTVPYAWLHQPVWFDPTQNKIMVVAAGDRAARWTQPSESALLLGWALGSDMVSWGVALRLMLGTAAPTFSNPK